MYGSSNPMWVAWRVNVLQLVLFKVSWSNLETWHLPTQLSFSLSFYLWWWLFYTFIYIYVSIELIYRSHSKWWLLFLVCFSVDSQNLMIAIQTYIILIFSWHLPLWSAWATIPLIWIIVVALGVVAPTINQTWTGSNPFYTWTGKTNPPNLLSSSSFD